MTGPTARPKGGPTKRGLARAVLSVRQTVRESAETVWRSEAVGRSLLPQCGIEFGRHLRGDTAPAIIAAMATETASGLLCSGREALAAADGKRARSCFEQACELGESAEVLDGLSQMSVGCGAAFSANDTAEVRGHRPCRSHPGSRLKRVESRRHSMTGRAIAGGSRPARSQPVAAATSGTPATIRTRGSTGTRPR